MSDPLSSAMADLATKEKELARIQGEIEKLRVFIEMYKSYTSKMANGRDGDASRSKKDRILDVAIDIINKLGSPIPLSVLHDEIEASGVEIGTSNSKQYLSTILNRDKRFKSIQGAGWILAD